MNGYETDRTPRSSSIRDARAAMEQTGLTEEEAWFLLRFAGRLGYSKAISRMKSPWKNLRTWFVWFGGWESPEISQWDRGKPAWDFSGSPWPVSFFGHRITLHDKWGDVRCFRGRLVFANDHANEWFNRIYWSPNGTPGHERVRMIADWSKGRRKRRAEND